MSRVGLLAVSTLLACARAYEDVSAAPEALEPEITSGDVIATLSCSHHGNPPPKISWRFQTEIADCTGRYTQTSDGSLVINPLHPSDSGIYTCEADNGLEVVTQQIHLTVNGVDCELYEECEKLHHCDFGVERITDVDGCERCECKQNPCKMKSCAEGMRCVLQKTMPLNDQESLFSAECKTMVKTGACPADETSPYNDTCPHECADDADCRGVGKCCRRGCSLLCLAPVTKTNINYFLLQQIIYPAFVPETSITSEFTEITKETAASFDTSEGNTNIEETTAVDGITPPCSGFQFGCCADNETEASGPDGQGCPCNTTEFGCCPGGVLPALGLDNEGCRSPCSTTPHGCCLDGKTPAHGPEYEGCCLLQAYGCCSDNRKPAEGPNLEGCGCQYALYGCCPDNVTIAQGPDNLGCSCQYTQNGCCLDRHTAAFGPNNEGCACNTYQFGCCADGVTIAKGPDQQGCHCRDSKFGCCGDGETPATGFDTAGCDCSSSRHGCCSDGRTEATGPKFLGCTDAPENKQAACSMSIDLGPCHNFTLMWFYDMTYGGCSQFWYGGCEGNGNRFSTKADCKDVCVQPSPKDACKLPSVKGACNKDYQRWYYDREQEKCVDFEYGGCLGNANNFDTQELCQKQCKPSSVAGQCDLPIDQGPCAGNYSRWGFNPKAYRCEQFIWGGCEGNSNRFSSEAACQIRCADKQPPRCTQPQEEGNCDEKEALWSFSQLENRCLPFYYSGCWGNDNRFGSREACEQTCPSAYVPDKCTLPAETGQCSDYRERWFYDTTFQRCCQFNYSGCGGNENNFATEVECDNSCSEIKTTTSTTTTARPAERLPQPQHPDKPISSASERSDMPAAAPLALLQQEPEVAASVGGIATLRCLFHDNPPPKITWRFGELTIDGNASRYRLMSDGALQIVSLYLKDTGDYTCTADNGLGVGTQQKHLVVNDPVKMPVGIAGDENAVVTGELGQPLRVRCLAYGYPSPAVLWYRGHDGAIVPYADAVYKTCENNLLIRSLAIETLGDYTCQAYNGESEVVSWMVSVRAYMPEGVLIENEWLVPRNTLPPRLRTQPPTSAETSITTTTSTTTEAPRSLFTVPVSAHVSTPFSTLNIGADLRLTCEIDGFPEPDVYWTKDGANTQPDGARVFINETTIVSRLLVTRVMVADSGLYTCHASNSYSSQSDTAQINVQQLTIPAECIDNPFFANCDLIVRNKFCRNIFYGKHCCKSCVDASQLDPQEAALQADDQPLEKK